jgi:hypothetical protein
MRRFTPIVAAAAVVVLIAAGVVYASGARKVTAPTKIVVVERPTSDTVIDTGAAGDSAGDLLTFANKLYNAKNTKQVGRDQGDCIRISPAKGSWECRWIAFLGDGAITVEGPFYDSHASTLAITGGRGMYRNARGTMRLKFGPGGNFTFVYHVLP